MESAQTVITGELAGTTSAKQLPDIPCAKANIKAVRSNSGNVYIGGASVTKVTGANNETAGFELDAGEETGWLPISNLNQFFRICDNAGDDIVWMITR